MHFRRLTIILSIGAAVLIWQVAVKSQNSGVAIPADCKDKQRVQFHSSGSFIDNDTSHVNCVVDYWICGNHYAQSKVVKNGSGECDGFRDSVMANVPATVCCDCYPNCSGNSSGNDSVAAGSDNAQKQDCCGDAQQMKAQIRQLQDEVRALENKLNGSNITLGSGAGRISISNDGVSISSTGGISIKATGNVTIKGAKVTTN